MTPPPMTDSSGRKGSTSLPTAIPRKRSPRSTAPRCSRKPTSSVATAASPAKSLARRTGTAPNSSPTSNPCRVASERCGHSFTIHIRVAFAALASPAGCCSASLWPAVRSGLAISLVTESLDGIESGGAHRRPQPRGQSNEGENSGRDGQGGAGDAQHEVPFAGLLAINGAPQRQRPEHRGDPISDGHAHQAAGKRNQERFGQKLQEDVPAARPERLLRANLTRALHHRNQHDVHHSHATDCQRQRAYKRKQHLERAVMMPTSSSVL